MCMQHDVVRALADGLMELDVDRRFRRHVAGGMRLAHALDDAVEQRQIVRRGAPGGEFGGDALDLAAIFEIVDGRLAMGGEKLGDRPREDLADDVGDIGAATMAGGQQAARLEIFQGVAQDRPRHVELARQLALARQPVA